MDSPAQCLITLTSNLPYIIVTCRTGHLFVQELSQVLAQLLLYCRRAGLVGQQVAEVLLVVVPLKGSCGLAVSIPGTRGVDEAWVQLQWCTSNALWILCPTPPKSTLLHS